MWTLDGVVITDMAAIGASPTYFDFDAFDEIQISTGGNDIRQRTGGIGLNFVVKRGTNQFRGTLRGYFTNDSLESATCPTSCAARGVTRETADHNKQITDYGLRPRRPDRARTARGSGVRYVKQDIRLCRQAGACIDRTILKTTNVKVQLAGDVEGHDQRAVVPRRQGEGRPRDRQRAGRAELERRWNQGNNYPDNRPHGLLKIENNRVFIERVPERQVRLLRHRLRAEPAGGSTGRRASAPARPDVRPTNRDGVPASAADRQPRRQPLRVGRRAHDIKFGVRLAPHRLVLADAVARRPASSPTRTRPTDRRARVYREGAGTNRTEYLNFYVGDTITLDRLTVDLGVRYDRQGGKALPSQTHRQRRFPDSCPASTSPATTRPSPGTTCSPRVGMTYALDEAARRFVRASFSRVRGPARTRHVRRLLEPERRRRASSSIPGSTPTTTTSRSRARSLSDGPLSRSAAASTRRARPRSPRPTSSTRTSRRPDEAWFVVGLERELMPNLAVSVNYTWSRNTGVVGGNNTGDPIGLTFARWISTDDYRPGALLTGTICRTGGIFGADVRARRREDHGQRQRANAVELPGLFRRLPGRRAVGRQAHVEPVDDARRVRNNRPESFDGTPVNVLGNPTRRDTDALVEGGQLAPRSAGSGAGDVFVNAGWQFNVNGAYELPWGIEVAGNVFGREGTRSRSTAAWPLVATGTPRAGRRRDRRASASTTCGTSICGHRRACAWIGSRCSSSPTCSTS